MRFRWPFPLALGTCLILVASPLLADDSKEKGKEVAVSDLPKAVREAADEAGKQAKLKQVQWKQACVRDEPGRQVFDIEGEDHDGRRVKTTISESGQLLTISREVPESEVPEKVIRTLKDQIEDFDCEEISAIYGKDGQILSFEFNGKQDGKPRCAVIDTSGRLLDASEKKPSKE